MVQPLQASNYENQREAEIPPHHIVRELIQLLCHGYSTHQGALEKLLKEIVAW